MSIVRLRGGEEYHSDDPRQVDLEDLTKVDEMPVHPAAEVFPMLDEEALQELAEDILQNGLQVPVVIDRDGVLIDGRNRLAACKIAGVDPRFETLDGDPLAYIISANVNRRHLNVGQRAMAWALVYPEPQKRGRGNTSDLKDLLSKSFSASRLSQARVVLHFGGRELAMSVMAGSVALNDAYKRATQRKDEKEQIDRTDAEAREKLARLKKAAPDLAEMVEEERMTVDEALAALAERERANEMHRNVSRKAVQELNDVASNVQAVILGLSLGEQSILERPSLVDTAVRSLNYLREQMDKELRHEG